MNRDELSAFIDRCYSGVIESDNFSELLNETCKIFGLRGAVIIAHDGRPVPEILYSSNMSDMYNAYSQFWWQNDTRTKKCLVMAPDAGSIVSDEIYFPSAEQQRDVFIQDFCRPNDLGDFMGYFARAPASTKPMTVSAIRSRMSCNFGETDRQTFKTAAKHIARAHVLNREVQAYRNTIGNLQSTIASLGFGLVLLDGRGSVMDWNDVAEDLLQSTVRVSRGQSLSSKVPSEQRKIDRVIRHALTDASQEGGQQDGDAAIIVPRGTGRGFTIRACPLTGTGSAFSRNARVALIVRPLVVPRTTSIVEHLQELGLTPTEARVAMGIGRGETTQNLAEHLSIRTNTLRVHLRNIYQKLDIDRQSKLCSIVSSIDHNLAR